MTAVLIIVIVVLLFVGAVFIWLGYRETNEIERNHRLRTLLKQDDDAEAELQRKIDKLGKDR